MSGWGDVSSKSPSAGTIHGRRADCPRDTDDQSSLHDCCYRVRVSNVFSPSPSGDLQIDPVCGIIFGLSTLAIGITALLVGPFDDFVRDTAIGTLVSFSPLVVVLTAILVGIKWISRVVLWNTIVLTSLILDWAGVWAYFWALS
ncbi:hypothetical protein [Bradyrhizobium sp. USDA 4452]